MLPQNACQTYPSYLGFRASARENGLEKSAALANQISGRPTLSSFGIKAYFDLRTYPWMVCQISLFLSTVHLGYSDLFFR
jgi:hypothetical protein